MANKLFQLVLFLSLGLQYCNCQDLILTLLTDEPAATGASCLDGSSPGYYMRPGTGEGANKWLLHLIGGGWCFTVEECYNRSFTALGSSSLWPETRESVGIYSDSALISPDFYNWNVVLFLYCDGASFAGDNEDPDVYSGRSLYYRGYRNLKAIIRHLNEERGLSDATDVILTGCSAGGLAVILHADFVGTLVSATAKYRAFPDAGYFLNLDTFSDDTLYSDTFNSMLRLQNIDDAIIPECKADHNGTGELWKCLVGPEIYSYIQTPIYVLNSRYDSLVLLFLLSCSPPDCTDRQAALIDIYKDEFDRQAQPILSGPPRNGYFLESCIVHCHNELEDVWNTYAINGVTIAKSFGDWYFDRSNDTRLRDTCDYPCNPSCPIDSGAIKNIPSPYLAILMVLSLCSLAASFV